MNGLNRLDKKNLKTKQQQAVQEEEAIEKDNEVEEEIEVPKEPKKSIFEKWGDRFRDFLDNAE